jgi:hypothetical protein
LLEPVGDLFDFLKIWCNLGQFFFTNFLCMCGNHAFSGSKNQKESPPRPQENKIKTLLLSPIQSNQHFL